MIGQPSVVAVTAATAFRRVLLQPTTLRHLSTTTLMQRGETSQGQVHPGYLKIREQYKRFQVEDGTPVHLKGGPFDKFLYSVTLALIAVGLVGCVEYFYTAAYPPKPK